MANLRDLKKEIDYCLEELVRYGYLLPAFEGEGGF